ncbi:MAG TPA: NUDIX domain-containing protein [Devosiaceae bacterium]
MVTANAASLAVFLGEKVLLIRRARAPFEGFWSLPGGRIEPGETPAECAIREIGEEMGLRVADIRPVSQITAGNPHEPFRLQVFATRKFAGEPHPSDEVADWGWYVPEDAGNFATTPGLGHVLDKARAIVALLDGTGAGQSDPRD